MPKFVSKQFDNTKHNRQFVADGVFRAELGEFFTRELAAEGYSGCDVRVTHARTEVIAVLSFQVLNLIKNTY